MGLRCDSVGAVHWQRRALRFIGSNEAVAEHVCGGERPGGCPDALWALLQRTWVAAPAERPTFIGFAGELQAVTSVDQQTIQVLLIDDAHGVSKTVPIGPYFLPLNATHAQLKAFVSRMIGYPAKQLSTVS